MRCPKCKNLAVREIDITDKEWEEWLGVGIGYKCVRCEYVGFSETFKDFNKEFFWKNIEV